MGQFDLEFLQAVNDWQRGGSHQQKVKRGRLLKALAQDVDGRFRTCSVPCFRQEAHEEGRLWQLLAEDMLDETIAAWTIDLQTSKDLKGGVPPSHLQGVIFEITPPKDSVVINLVELYQDAQFIEATQRLRSEIDAYADGIGRYGSSQYEVVLDLGSLRQAHVRHYGGFPSDYTKLAEIHYQRKPSQEEVKEFERLCGQANIQPSEGWWLSTEGTQRVMSRVLPRLSGLKAFKAAQTE